MAWDRFKAPIGKILDGLKTCRLCWRITGAVFLAILAIEAVILAFSVRDHQRLRLMEVEREALVTMRAILQSADIANARRDTLSELDLTFRRNSTLVGARIFGTDDRALTQFGDAPPMDIHAVPEIGILNGDNFLIVQWDEKQLRADYRVVARVDAREVPVQVRNYIWRVSGLILLIAAFITFVLMLILERLILRPLRSLNQGLLQVSDRPDRPGLGMVEVLGRDELRNITASFNGLLVRLQAAFDEIHHQQATLKSQNANLESSVAERTSELRKAVKRLRRRAVRQDDSVSPIGSMEIAAQSVDTLTGLASRAKFWDHAGIVLQQAKRDKYRVAILSIDLDDFGKINEGAGFDVGDQILQEIGERIRQVVRNSDMVARFGADEFAILQTRIVNEDEPLFLAERLIANLATPIETANTPVNLDCSIGIFIVPDDGLDIETGVVNAHLAMRKAKAVPGSAYRFFHPEMEQSARRFRAMELDLRRGYNAGELELYYQPKLDVGSRRIFGMEALLRWKHPAKGFVSPVEFIPVAERTRFINEIGDWVIASACRQTRQWNRIAIDPLKVSVNVSAIQIKRGQVVDTLRRVLLETDLDPKFLEVEITESAVMENVEQLSDALMAIRALGISIAIDDFGTGYTSLQYLQNLPVNRVKIDRAFVKGLGTSKGDPTIARAISGIGRSFGLQITAEGVETKQEFDMLSAEGCHEIQGFLVSRPLDSDAFIQFVLDQKAGPATKYDPRRD